MRGNERSGSWMLTCFIVEGSIQFRVEQVGVAEGIVSVSDVLQERPARNHDTITMGRVIEETAWRNEKLVGW